jgi:SAM-dependent methyltransferase
VRKDYVEAANASASEAVFVEDYWTGQWRDRTSSPDASRVTRLDEYPFLQRVLATLSGGSRILDGGCGLGEWTVFLAQQGFDITGIDLSEATVARLRKWFPDRDFVAGDLRRTSFPDQSFDAYFSWGTFEHFEAGLGECLEEARRIVRPGGWLLVSVPFHNGRLIMRDHRPLECWDEAFDARSGYAVPQRFYQWRLTRQELRRELELHGFRVEQVTPIGKRTGAGRMLQWDLPLLAKGSRPYAIASRLLAAGLPASFIGHMIVAVGQRR